ncbi:hypothetical protein KKE03_00685, partial [Patescibacteria group bacterium]|nr:hypothetical protein [Patescibacteria group bacterium]
TRNAQGAVQSVPVLSQVNLSGGALGATTSLIGMLYANPPVRTADYLASLGEGMGIVKTANAQVTGSGAAVLNPIIKLWQVSRNISYVIMIVIFVVIGLMIMFRNKLNPQTVITAQTALPGLVVGLILITFSYFLAGLISDVAFVGTNVVGYYFQAAQNFPESINPNECPNPSNLVYCARKTNVLTLVSPLTGIINKDNAADMLGIVWGNLSEDGKRLLTFLGVFVAAQTTSQATELFKAIPSFGQGIQALATIGAAVATLSNPTAVIGIALAFIATAILMYAMIKLLLRLINCFITIIFLTITAPFQLLAASLPGRQGLATNWILNMLCNVLAFPAVFAVLYFVVFILGPENTASKQLPFQISSGAAITDLAAFPLFGGINLSYIKLLLAFAVLVASPSIPDIICRAVGRMGQAGQLIGQEIGGSIGQGRQYAGQFQAGVGQGAGQIAQARGLFGSPAYMPSGFDKQGKPTGWTINPMAYQPNIVQKLQARRVAAKGEIHVPGS